MASIAAASPGASRSLNFESTMARCLADGGLERHLRRMRKVYAERLEVMTQCLHAAGFEFRKPHGGMSIWVDVGADSTLVAQEAQALGLPLQPGEFYALDDSLLPVRHLRLGFASTTKSEIEQGIGLLAQAKARAMSQRSTNAHS